MRDQRAGANNLVIFVFRKFIAIASRTFATSGNARLI